MTMQPRPHNPIQQRKDQVRKYARNGVISVAGGLAGGFLVGLFITKFWLWMTLGIVIAVVGGTYNFLKVRRIVNHRDEY
ncbi:hypothetical protein C3B44_03840 [Corynebacterium yudongzhengii]|uniref:Secreted protein n=1 Tax=Corynebacterium yudongzhengii TaxID=2080740 RepID=A0A2U1T6I7_9CORY|nr:hypothetical protein [Corynebacterium yudongzhengii]AWB82935.1 hypothetical protein C3B44_03840 [Corynebacterium yudongzhengii]PWC01630.1 hypothetical protein DF222_06500 [Corynebacterium yudongzhengii]